MPAGVFKETYLQDMAFLRYPIHWAGLAVLASTIVLLPFVLGDYGVNMLVSIMVFLVGAIGLNIVTGLAGQISLAHGALMGVGAYTTVYLALKGVNILAALPVAALVSALVGFILGLPSFRLKEYYLAMASIAAQMLLEYIFKTIVDPHQGISVPDSSKTIAGYYIGRSLPLYYTVLAVTILAVLFAANIGRSSLGRAMKSIRDNDVSASIVGVNVAYTKALAFTLGSLYAGLAGALYVLSSPAIGWDAFTIDKSVEYLSIILIGGPGRIIWGSLLGTLTIRTGWNLLENMLGTSIAAKYIVLGLLTAGFVVLEPAGLIGVLRKVKEYFRLWPFRY